MLNIRRIYTRHKNDIYYKSPDIVDIPVYQVFGDPYPLHCVILSFIIQSTPANQECNYKLFH
jgi:hypothetical protein